jgi:hypothetical protein
MNKILIMGATSAIAEAVARELAAEGASLFLAGRSRDRLEAIAADLRIRGAARVAVGLADALEVRGYPALVEEAVAALDGLDAALIAHGTLPDQADCEQSIDALCRELQVNAVSVIALAMTIALHFQRQRRGVLAVISSVAGDRGRRSNYAYGAAKSAVTAFTSGLRQRMHADGVRIVTVKPGFVDTPMTARFRKGLLWASPASVAAAIVRAMRRGTPVLYVPWFWRPIMLIIRLIPERLFRKLSL